MRNRSAIAISSGLVLAGLVGTGWAAGYALGDTPDPVTSTATVAAAVAPTASSVARVTTAATPMPTPAVTKARKKVVRQCSVAGAAGDPRLASFQGRVMNARTGEVLLSVKGTKASRAASVMKVLTSAAALKVLGPDHRLTTRVVKGERRGEIVIVGGGDVTLSRTPEGTATAYAGAPHLATLAAKVKKAWKADPANDGVRIRRIVLDGSYFGGPDWQPTWKTKERTEGWMPKMTALMVDGDRDAPGANGSRRSEDPIGRAGAAFASYFDGAKVTRGTAPAGAETLGTVKSQPVRTLVKQTLIVSDNAIAETLARVTAIESGHGNTFTAENPAVLAGLREYGIEPTKVRVVDGSGLSDDNRIPPSYLTELFVKVLHRDGALGAVYDGLPVAGRTGSLSYADRFSGAASKADGKVFAKTGWIDTGYTLAGIIKAKDGTKLTFAFYALGNVSSSAKTALDALTADVWSCGNRLADL